MDIFTNIIDILRYCFQQFRTWTEKYVNEKLWYVTPEMFGAAGDGTTDDTAAFAAAIETGKPIICPNGKTYYFSEEIITNKTRINLDGNYCQFKNFRLKINVNEEETGWVAQYPHTENTIKNICFMNDGMDYCIKTGVPLHLENIYAYYYGLWLKNYGTYMDYMVFDNVNIMYGQGDQYAIELSYLGDIHVFRDCGFTAGSKAVQISGCKAATFMNCLNGSYMIYESVANFISCHFEEDGTVAIGDEGKVSSVVNFDGCFFWDNYTTPNRRGISYTGCEFFINFRSYKGTNDYLALDSKNCVIICSTTGNKTESLVILDELRKDVYDYVVWSGNKAAIAGSSSKLEDAKKSWDAQEGTYQYVFFQSSNPHSIEYGNFSYSKAELEFDVSASTSAIKIRIDDTYRGMYLHVFRINPDSSIQKAVLPNLEGFIFDYGATINGIRWETADAIPAPENSTAILRNGVYYAGNEKINAKGCLCVNKNTGEVRYIAEE